MSFRVIYGNSRSENGWRMCNADETDSLPIPGSNVRIPLRRGAPSIIMRAFASRFHQLIEPLDQTQCGGWTPTNTVPTSNHLAGSAMDLNWRKHPFLQVGTFGTKLGTLRNILKEFEGTIFWGGDWASPKDEMHFQMAYDCYEGSPKAEAFAARLVNGHLGIYTPANPTDFPLPKGYFYGPLDGPNESVSGEWDGEQQSWRDGLGRWQAALGLRVTKKWNDGVTPKAATALQLSKKWSPNPDFGYGGVYEGEWNAVMKEGWRLPTNWTPDAPVPTDRVKWADVSQYQSAVIDASYPYPVVAFRASVANKRDEKFLANMAAARQLVRAGKLKKIIAYHFWVPGHDNVGTFLSAITDSGGVFPELAFMLDVEDGGTKWNIKGDQSTGANDFIKRASDFFGGPWAASGYINFRTNQDLWQSLPHGLKLIVPSYNGPNGSPWTPPGITAFGHQYADNENTPPFGPCDINQARMTLDAFLAAFAPPPPPPGPPVVVSPEAIGITVWDQFKAGAATPFVPPAPPPPPPSRYWPMRSGTYSISSGFGPRWGTVHRGLDFAAKDGERIYAVAAGRVDFIGSAQGFGQWIVLRHDDGTSSVYGHMWNAAATGLKVGSRVAAGQHIAFVGNNGESTGAHLHLEIHPGKWAQGSQVDPQPWLKNAANPPAMFKDV